MVMKNSISEIFKRSGLAIQLTIFSCFLCGAFFSVDCFAQASTPALRDEKAIERLKQDGSYDSLMKAVKASHSKNGQTDDVLTSGAFAQSAKLMASDGAANDNLGYCFEP
jgi:hypothetical protein